jgi:hypothetical protein
LNGIIGLDNGQPDEDQCGREGNQRARSAIGPSR